ncbi:Uncharacterised protein [Mycobacteroides abscessus subsp. abscessus]|nr:Uncharacterised protein [Mycobacteroides abscessus subsp. abscessus]
MLLSSIIFATFGSDMNSAQRPAGSSRIASPPLMRNSQVDSGVSPAPGSRVDRPTMAMSCASPGV